MRKILVVGAGQSGLHLALGLQSHGYEVTLMSNRTPDEIRAGRIMSTQCMFDSALRHERDLGLNFWEAQAPRIEGVGVSVAGPDGERAVDWVGRLRGYAQAVDQRVKMAGWLETFARRGGQLVVHGAAVSDLDWFSRVHDLVLVTAGKGELVRMFARDAARSPHTEPQRSLAAVYVHGLRPRPEHPEFDAARCNLVPGLGELVVQPVLTTSGRADALFWLGRPGGPLDVFDGVRGAEEQLALTLDLMRRYVPWEYARATGAEVTDAGAALTGRYTPVVRHPVALLPGGVPVLGAGDVVVANDPLTGQGANSATKCAAVYLAAILDHGDGEFDEAWMRRTFERFWQVAGPATKWTNTMLAPPAEHVRELVGAAEGLPVVADRFANGFDDPADFEGYFYEAEKTRAYLSEVSGP
ncbi:styrene monooxygenase/indole monooxygenase family protein [Streptomyces scabiei]|uniref:styrene monooxygenase/indole monooxygenase family protein n=1 Tax=Streptomyces scabiei TaxID=1930 RepID=UPI0029B35832|nr:styrene monooxygenase/indole monooxygenase family protein [Streptomyces scabiei]MDX3522903.1 FAD-binding oxidoreductase [Streptomyces scabiei]